MNDLQKRLENTSEAIYTILSENVAKSILPNNFSGYSLIEGSSSFLSDWVENAVPVLAKMSRDAPQSHRKRIIDQIVTKILLIFKSALNEKLIKLNTSLSLHRFVLDLNFLLHLTGSMLQDETNSLYDELIDMTSKGSIGNLDRPLPSNSQMENEIHELEVKFSEFSIYFNKN